MATPDAENLRKAVCSAVEEHMNCIQKSLEYLPSLTTEDITDRKMLRSRIDEQSNLICILKQRADKTLLRCQALQKINTELEDQATHCRKELESERKRAETLAQRFFDLSDNNEAIIAFMEEHKNHNAQLKEENKQLRSENDSLFSQKLHNQEVHIQKLTEEMKLLTEKYTNKENEYWKKLDTYKTKHQEQETHYKAKEASQLNQLSDFKLKLQEAKEQYALLEISMRESITSISKDKDRLLELSMERGKEIQEKQQQIQQLESKLKEERKARIRAEDRFEQEAQTVNANLRVKSLQSALDEATIKFQKLQKDFNAFKEHSANLLTQERELNKRLRHMKL
ncbi:coiled-coil domain-containing protein 89 [Parambassis ranga]|uniref:Coiled-coil domain-containing protein 89 n=1 Tax=Parambassis ranga TaxID=210632 RepID=A0A6P7HL76_9TELE|nr:coiled-coil domain-containing protein 89 [Parambassis ranga]